MKPNLLEFLERWGVLKQASSREGVDIFWKVLCNIALHVYDDHCINLQLTKLFARITD